MLDFVYRLGESTVVDNATNIIKEKYTMSRPRGTASHLILSGQTERKPQKYSKYNLTEGVIPTDGTIVAPKGLSKTAKKAWNVTVPALLQMKSLSVTDFVQLENLFITYDELLTVRKAMADYDKEHTIAESDYIEKRKKLNTWFNNTQATFTTLASRFGMTPADRTRLPMDSEDDGNKDPLEVIIG